MECDEFLKMKNGKLNSADLLSSCSYTVAWDHKHVFDVHNILFGPYFDRWKDGGGKEGRERENFVKDYLSSNISNLESRRMLSNSLVLANSWRKTNSELQDYD